MFKIDQYSSLFSIIVYGIILLPSIFAGLYGKRNKYLILATSMVIIILLLGIKSLEIIQFGIFFLCEMILIFLYQRLKANVEKGKKDKILFYLALFLSMVPIILIKVTDKMTLKHHIGFIGASYICFKIWELLIEIYDGKIKKLGIIDTVNFLIFAPAFSSGPIARYDKLQMEIQSDYENGSDYINNYLTKGIRKIIIGMFYKFALAFWINEFILSNIEGMEFKKILIYMYGYTLYLFFDFAGYSMMAIGTGQIMGISLPDNFNKPFLARNMKEFWERWHISLSTWFNDYLFSRVALRLMRRKKIKKPAYVARISYMITMTVMGIWHGLYIHYILYGLYQGMMLVLSDIWTKSKAYRTTIKKKYYDWTFRFICFHIIAFGMLIFSGYLIPQ